MARPNDSTTAYVGYNLLIINDLDTEEQEFISTGWFTVIWHDDRLMWVPSTYDDTSYIHALETEIWKPEIIISNAQEDVGLISDDHLIYRIKYTGHVEWEPLISTTVDCEIDVTYFPFDNQECQIEVTSWGLPDTELDLKPLWDDVKLNEYRGSASWEITSSSVEKSTVREDLLDTVEYFSKLNFKISLRRKAGNYIFNTIVPMILSTFMMTFSNIIPMKSGERLTSGFLVLLINTLLITIFVQQIPDIAITTAILGVYLTFAFCLDCVRMIITIILVKLYHRPTRFKVNIVIRCIITGMRFFLLIRKPPDEPVEEDTVSVFSIPTDDLRKIEKSSQHKRNAVHPLDVDAGFTDHVKITDDKLPPLTAQFDIDLRRAKRKMRKSSKGDLYETDSLNNVKERKKEFTNKEPKMTWHFVAFVLDRLFFIVFLCVKIAFNFILIGRLFSSYHD